MLLSCMADPLLSPLIMSLTFPSVSTSLFGVESYHPLVEVILMSAQALNSSYREILLNLMGDENIVIYLSSTANAFSPIVTLAPAVTSHISPLEDTQVTCEV